jgi:hypothetical protein
MATKRIYKTKPKVEAKTVVEPEIKGVPLCEIKTLDLRNMTLLGRACVLHALQEAGYIWRHTMGPMLDCAEDLHFTLLDLNHVNKIAYALVEDDLEDDDLLSAVNVSTTVTLSFDPPKLAIPDSISYGNATYALKT